MAATEGFDEAYPELFVLAQRVAQKIVQNPDVAEDVAAETLARAMVSWRRVKPYARAWVTRVAINQAIDLVRRRKATPAEPVAVAHDDVVVSRIVLVAALRKLPRRQREVVALRYLIGLTEAESAALLGVGAETVKSHARRGLGSLREHLTDRPEDVNVAH